MRLVLVLLACLLAATRACAGPGPVLGRSIEMPGVSGRIDHLAYDPKTERLYVAALGNGSLEAIDLTRGERIKSVGGLREPQGVVFVPSMRRVVVACGGDGTVRAFDAETLEEIAKVGVGDDADNERLDADGTTIVVGYGGGALAFLDGATLRKKGEIRLSGHPESFQLDPGAPRIFVNVPGDAPGGGRIEVADRAGRAVTATWKLSEAGRNYPMALDAAHERLYVGCRRPARLLVLDCNSGKVVASPECVGDADDVFLDALTGRVLVVGGDGAIDVFEAREPGGFGRVASVKTAPGARTGLLAPERRALFVAVPRRPGHEAEIREYALAPPRSIDRENGR